MASGSPFHVGVIGIGQMGKALVYRLSRSSEELFPEAGSLVIHVWNRSQDVVDSFLAEEILPFTNRVVQVHRNVESLIESSQQGLVITMLPDYQSTRDLLFPTGESSTEVKRGWFAVPAAAEEEATASGQRVRRLMCLNSGDPDQAREFASWVQEKRPETVYYDGCFVGSPKAVRLGSGTLLYTSPLQPSPAAAGSEEGVRRVLEVLAGTPERAVHCGEKYGSAKGLDYALVDAYFLNYVAYLHSRALAEAEGVPLDTLHRCLENHARTFPAAWSRTAATLLTHNYANQTASLAVWRQFFAHRADYLATSQLSPVVPDLGISLIDRAVAQAPAATLSDDLIRIQDLFRKPLE